MDKYQIPQWLDEPFKVILWTMDEVIVFLIPFLILFVGFNQPLFATFLGIGSVMGLKKLKGTQGIGFIYGWMYWYLPALIRLKSWPPSHIRELFG